MEQKHFSHWRELYEVIAQRLVGYGAVTREQCDTIARVGHRKQRYWKRHIIDLCEFAMEHIERNGLYPCKEEATATCMAGLKLVKGTHEIQET